MTKTIMRPGDALSAIHVIAWHAYRDNLGLEGTSPKALEALDVITDVTAQVDHDEGWDYAAVIDQLQWQMHAAGHTIVEPAPRLRASTTFLGGALLGGIIVLLTMLAGLV